MKKSDITFVPFEYERILKEECVKKNAEWKQNRRIMNTTILENSRDKDCSLDRTRCQCFRSDCLIFLLLKIRTDTRASFKTVNMNNSQTCKILCATEKL